MQRSMVIHDRTTGVRLFSVTRDSALTTLALNEAATVRELKSWMQNKLYSGLRPKDRGCQQLIAVIEQALVSQRSIYEQHCPILSVQPWIEATAALVSEERSKRRVK